MTDVTRATPFADLPDIMSTAEAAAWAGLGLNKTRAMLKTGELPGIRWGDRWMIPKAALLKRLNDMAWRSSDET